MSSKQILLKRQSYLTPSEQPSISFSDVSICVLWVQVSKFNNEINLLCFFVICNTTEKKIHSRQTNYTQIIVQIT